MISRFFIDRPIFATVLSVVITLIGLIALAFLPVAQYPRITPPGVAVSMTYPGASAQVLADTVAAPVEQQVNGVEGMLYMSSQMGNDGTYTLTVTFDIGTDLKTALVMVQNRVALAMPQLPIEVQNQGIMIRKKTPDILIIVNFYSPDSRYDDVYLSNYATIYVKDELLRVPGVSDITYQGERDYSIRAWLDPQKLAACNITAVDVSNAVQNQNLDAPAGQVGQPPSLRGQSYQLPVDTLGRLSDPEQFGDIIIKVGQNRPKPKSTGGATASSSSNTGLPGSSVMGLNMSASNTAGGSSSLNGSSSSSSTSSSSSSSSSSTALYDPNTPIGSPSALGTSTGGGTTSGGAATGGGGTSVGGGATGGGATGGAMTISSIGDVPSGSGSNSGIISSAMQGRGPGLPSAAIVRLRDVARMELGAQNYNLSCMFDGHQAVGLSVYQLPGTNALEVADAVRDKMEELKTHFPDGVAYAIGYDTTPYIRESVWDVVKTLLEAVLLVGLVVLVFLQDWRAMILPLIDVPVSIIGTFAVMAVLSFIGETYKIPSLNFSLNNISLFGLVLAIGIVVDDAIVVLENIERMMAKGYDARTATIKAMDEVTGPIIAVSLVLCAVFVPCAFIRGITGQFFNQFAVTIAASTVISAVNAVTMTPSRAVLIFKAEEGHKGHEHKREALPWWFFGVLGGLTTAWLGHEYHAAGVWSVLNVLSAPGGGSTKWLPWIILSTIYFIPGALVGLPFGWLVIRPVNAFLGWLFRGFNHGFDWMTAGYGWTVGKAMRLSLMVLLVYGILLGLTYWAFQKAPTGFIPQQDQGRLIVSIQLPDSMSLQSTQEAVAHIDKITRETEGVAHTVVYAGLSFILQANSSNFASMFVVLKPFDERQGPGLRDTDIMKKLREAWAKQVKSAVVTVYGASPIPGLGVAGGFKIIIEDRGGLGLAALQEQTEKVVRRLKAAGYKLTDKAFAGLKKDEVPADVLAKLQPLKDKTFTLEDNYLAELAKVLDKAELARYQKLLLTHALIPSGLNSVSTQFRSNTPQLYLDIDREKVASVGVSLDDVNQTLDIYLGSLYVNSFNAFGRHWQVTLQAEGDYRNRIEQLNLFKVRNNKGQMVPLGTLLTPREIGGPISITRYNLYTSASISGNILGVSSGDAINMINRTTAETLPLTMKSEWTEVMFMQLRAGNTAFYIFLLSILCVFLALSALYESWALPLAVILVVPLCLLCSVSGVLITNRDVNIFVQIGLVVLVGLACKNAILVVEYAKQLHQEGRSVYDATKEASKLRLRPILMTSFAFIFGVLPLVFASGAGAEMRRSLGTAVFSGMLGVTIFGIFLTPVFFYIISNTSETALFRTKAMQQVSTFLMWFLVIITFGLYGLLLLLLARKVHQDIARRLANEAPVDNNNGHSSYRDSNNGPTGGHQP